MRVVTTLKLNFRPSLTESLLLEAARIESIKGLGASGAGLWATGGRVMGGGNVVQLLSHSLVAPCWEGAGGFK